MDIGELTLLGYRFAAHTACMFRRSIGDDGRSGWGFFIAAESTDRPDDVLPDATGLWAEDEPIPLPELDDFTGLDFVLKESGRPEYGTAYFVFDAWEGHDVTDVCLQFLERRGEIYRVELSALVPHLLPVPTVVRYAGWVRVTEGPPPGNSPQDSTAD